MTTEVLRLPGTESPAPGFERGSVFFVGTATVVLRYAGFAILTDPNRHLAHGDTYQFDVPAARRVRPGRA